MFIVPTSRETRQLSRLLDHGFERFFHTEPNGDTSPRTPALDVAESDSTYTVQLDMPGVAKEDVKVEVLGRVVTVRAESQRSDDKKEGDSPADRTIYRERSVARFSRRFSLPTEVEQADSGAKLEHGVLTLTLPKRNAPGSAQITVN